MTQDTPFEKVGQYLSKEEESEEEDVESEEETDVEQGTPKE
jgi:hypothetical protein